MDALKPVIDHLRAQQAEHLRWACDWCRIPSVSTRPEHKADVAAAADWLCRLLTQVGLRAEMWPTEGHPTVFAESPPVAGAPTFVVYGHADVQPVGDLSLWTSPPFEPAVRDGLLLARGSADDKGQVLAHVRAAAAWLATHKSLPINLKFLIEGEEEIGSPHLPALLEARRERLRCDAILISDTGMYEDGWPTITGGTRGLLYKEIRLHGPKHDLHSGGFGGTVANPANVLAALIAGLHDDAGRVTIPGFYDDVLALTPAEAAALRALPLDDAQYARDLGVPGVTGERGFSTNERRWVRPTLDVNGIYGGFMAEGANTIIPRSAGAKISMRLVPQQDADKLSDAFDAALRERCPKTVRLEILNHGRAAAYVAPLAGPAAQAAHRALQEAFGRAAAVVREGGSLPILPLFRRILAADSLMLGFAGPNCNAHGPDENIRLDDLDRGAEALARLYGYLAAAR